MCYKKKALDDYEVQMYETFLTFSITLPVEETKAVSRPSSHVLTCHSTCWCSGTKRSWTHLITTNWQSHPQLLTFYCFHDSVFLWVDHLWPTKQENDGHHSCFHFPLNYLENWTQFYEDNTSSSDVKHHTVCKEVKCRHVKLFSTKNSCILKQTISYTRETRSFNRSVAKLLVLRPYF